MKGLGPRLRGSYGLRRRPPPGEWVPVFRLAEFQTWVIHYSCGHGLFLQFRHGSSGGGLTVDAAMGKMREEKRFICNSCIYSKDNPGIWCLIADVRRLR